MVVNCHTEVARILQNTERDEVRYLMDRFNKTIQVKAQGAYHQEQFDIYGRQERVEPGKEREGGRDRDRDRRPRNDRNDRGERRDRKGEAASPAESPEAPPSPEAAEGKGTAGP